MLTTVSGMVSGQLRQVSLYIIVNTLCKGDNQDDDDGGGGGGDDDDDDTIFHYLYGLHFARTTINRPQVSNTSSNCLLCD
jgi:hypothetical protein